jgi:hypothetical protein
MFKMFEDHYFSADLLLGYQLVVHLLDGHLTACLYVPTPVDLTV